jgi:hypothetical protein
MHVLRHTTAMTLLGAGIDTSTITLWRGHEQERTTPVCLHADLALKQRTLDRVTPQSHGDEQARSAARAALPAPLRDSHLGCDGVRHRDDRLAHELRSEIE